MEFLTVALDSAEWMAGFAIGSFVLIPIYVGTQRLAQYGPHRCAIFPLLFGCVVAIALGIFAVLAAEKMQESRNSVISENAMDIENLPLDWGEGMAVSEPVEKTRVLAQMYFVETGGGGRVFTIDSEWTEFSPSESDVDKREDMVRAHAQFDGAIEQLNNKGWGWFIGLFVAAGLGWLQARGKLW